MSNDNAELKFYSIRHRWTRGEIFSGEYHSFAACVEAAAKARAVLRGADLSKADLYRVDLRSVDLSYVNLGSADLRYADLLGAKLLDAHLSDANLRAAELRAADLRGANFSGADLRGADLYRADLRGANLSEADLSEADLAEANLSLADLSGADILGANLRGAYLSDANFRCVDLHYAREDLYSILDLTPNEVPAVREALVAGRINGSVYQGPCACLVGTIANARGCHYAEIPGIEPNGSRPAEQFFMNIAPGHTTDIDAAARIVLGWIDEWLAERAASPTT